MEDGRQSNGRFAKGNPGGKGGARPGSGRKPRPDDPTLLNKLYAVLDEGAPKALQVLIDALKSKDEKIRVKAADIITRKVLPDRSMLDIQREESEPGVTIHDIPEDERELLREYSKKISEIRVSRNPKKDEPEE